MESEEWRVKKKRRKTMRESLYKEKAETDVGQILLGEDRAFPAYKNLKVWGKAHENLLAIIRLLEPIPDTPITARIKDQLIGSASSIGANIAEGSSIYKGKKFVSYLQIALDSACETDNWLQILKDSNILNKNIDKTLLIEIVQRDYEVIKMLIKLIQSIENRRLEEV